MKPSPLTLRPASDGDSEMILGWRNHPEVRQVMFTNHRISPSEHAAWWRKAMADTRHRQLVMEWDGRPCGTVNFSNIDTANGCCDWGFYFDPDAFPDGLVRLRAWNEMEKQSMAYATNELHCPTIRCEVIDSNTAVLSMHRRYGFCETGRYQRIRGNEMLSVIRLQYPAPA